MQNRQKEESQRQPQGAMTAGQRLALLVEETERQLEDVLNERELMEYRRQKQQAMDAARRSRFGRWPKLRQLYKLGC